MNTVSRSRSGFSSWWVVFLLAFAYMISILDRVAISLLLTPIKRDLMLTDLQIALVVGVAFGLFYSFMGLPMGRMVDKFNRRNLIIIGIVTWSLMTFVCGISENYTQLFIGRMGVGVGEAVLAPAAWSMVSDLFPPERRAKPLAIVSIGSLLGGGVGFIASSALLDLTNLEIFASIPLLSELAPWRVVLILASVPGLVLAILFSFIREPVRGFSEAEEGERVESSPPALAEIRNFLFLRRKSLGLVSLGGGCVVMTYYSIISWAPTVLIRDFGLPIESVGYLFGVSVLVGSVIGSYVSGIVADRYVSRGIKSVYVNIFIASALGIFVSILCFSLAKTSQSAIIVLSIYCFSYALIMAPVAAYIQCITPISMRGVVSALYMLIVNLMGYVCGPPLVALVASTSANSSGAIGLALCLVCAVAAIVAAVLFYLSKRPSEKIFSVEEIRIQRVSVN